MREGVVGRTTLEAWLSEWLDRVAERSSPLELEASVPQAALAAGRAIAFQIERGELWPRDRSEFRGHCERILRVHVALVDLAGICKAGTESAFPCREPWLNADAWHNTYVALAARISDGRVDIERPLGPLAKLTAYRFFLSERRRMRRLSALTEEQLHRVSLGDESPPEERAEAARRARALREAIESLRVEGRLSEAEVGMLWRRYVEEWRSPEVAAAAGLTADNVRQICTRRCALLRLALAGQDLEEAAA